MIATSSLRTFAARGGRVAVLGLPVLAALSACGAANGSPPGPPSPTVAAGSTGTAAADWPMSADFPPGTIIPNELPDNQFRGWRDIGGSLLGGGALRSGTDVWGLDFERGGEDVVVVVMSNSRDADGNTIDWRVVTNLYFAPPDTRTGPVSLHECLLRNDPESTIFARWDYSTPPHDIWLFDDESLTFSALSAEQVDCVPLMDR